VLDDLPHLYPYVIDNPGEGIQAKRRSWAVILDHLIPAMTRAGGYGDLEELTLLLQEYFRASRNGEEAKTRDLLGDIARFQKRRERKRVISSSTGNSPHRSAHK
jgi:cobaltochelatase CobN